MIVTSLAREARNIIQKLERGAFRAICPCCEEDIRLRDAGLFHLEEFTDPAKELYDNKLEELKLRANELRGRETKIQQKSQTISQAVNIGFILERLAPSMERFPFNCNDCRSLFDPIDYVVFEGLCKGGEVNKILFVEIKTGHARLTDKQKNIRSLVEKHQVYWDTYKMEVGK